MTESNRRNETIGIVARREVLITLDSGQLAT